MTLFCDEKLIQEYYSTIKEYYSTIKNNAEVEIFYNLQSIANICAIWIP